MRAAREGEGGNERAKGRMREMLTRVDHMWDEGVVGVGGVREGWKQEGTHNEGVREGGGVGSMWHRGSGVSYREGMMRREGVRDGESWQEGTWDEELRAGGWLGGEREGMKSTSGVWEYVKGRGSTDGSAGEQTSGLRYPSPLTRQSDGVAQREGAWRGHEGGMWDSSCDGSMAAIKITERLLQSACEVYFQVRSKGRVLALKSS